MPIFGYSFTVAASLQAVPAFHRDTSAIKIPTPPPTLVRLHSIEPLAEGSVSTFALWVGPLPLRWKAVHRAVSDRGFTDVQAEGSAGKWEHTHSFVPLEAGQTEIREHLEYEQRPGPRGLVNRVLFSRPNLWPMFSFRAWVTRRHLRPVPACFMALMLAAAVATAAEPEPLLAVPGKVLFEDDFARDAMAPKWAAKGGWTVAGGVATADDGSSGANGPSCKAAPGFVYHDVVIDFDFRFESTKVLHLEMKDRAWAGTHTGHICCLSISPGEIRLSDYKNGVMENANYEKLADKSLSPEEKKRLRDELLAAHSRLHPFEVEKGRWHHARLEIVGDEMLLAIDATPVAAIRAPGIDHPTKNVLGFATRGRATHLRNVRVREATAAPGWPARRDAVIAALPQRRTGPADPKPAHSGRGGAVVPEPSLMQRRFLDIEPIRRAPKLKWKTRSVAGAAKEEWTNCIVHDGVMYGTARDVLHAIDADSGSLLWTAEGPGGHPAIHGDTVHAAGTDRFYALDRLTGTARWETPTSPLLCGWSQSHGFMKPATVVHDGVGFFGTKSNATVDCHYHAVDLATGAVLWKTKPRNEPWAARPTVGGGRLYGAFHRDPVAPGNPAIWGRPQEGSGLVALDVKTGEVLWSRQGPATIANPVYHDETLYVGHANAVAALDARTGETRWTCPVEIRGLSKDHPEGGNVTGLALHDGVLLAGGAGPTLVAIDVAARAERWRFHMPQVVEILSPLICRDVVVVSTCGKVGGDDPATGRNSPIVGLDLKTGRTLWECTVPGTDCVVDGRQQAWNSYVCGWAYPQGRRLFVFGFTGCFYCFEEPREGGGSANAAP